MYLRESKGSNATYVYLVHGYRENGRVKQKTIAALGRRDRLDLHALKKLGLQLLGLCPNNQLIDLEATKGPRKNKFPFLASAQSVI